MFPEIHLMIAKIKSAIFRDNKEEKDLIDDLPINAKIFKRGMITYQNDLSIEEILRCLKKV